jgi:ankyrin repeat protein
MALEAPQNDQVSKVYSWFSAVATADWNTMRSLFDGGLNIDVSHPLRQTTALMEATRQGRAKVVEWLLHHGAVPSFMAGTRTTTAIHVALKMQQWEIAERLLLAAPTAAMCDYAGRTPLHMLCSNIITESRCLLRAMKIAERTLAKGVSVDALDNEGISALHYCIINDLDSIAELLLQNGANPNIMSPESKVTPLTIAALEHQRHLAELLIRFGGCPNMSTQDGKTPLQLMPEMQQWIAAQATMH